MHRFFFQSTHRDNDRVRLDAEESRHALQVLRLKKGAEIILLDGLGCVFAARIEGTGGKAAQEVTAVITGTLPDNEPHTRVTLYQGLPKGGKLEMIVQKCTELGVHSVQPVQFARSVKEAGKGAEKTQQRLLRIAREAAKQCGRGQVPLIGAARPLSEVIGRLPGHGLVLVPWEEAGDGSPHLREVLTCAPPQEIALVIGPEGGIAPEEIEALRAAGASAVTLGPRILRTETAGVAALAAILALTGDL